ncbi:hypothetical protein D0Z08_31195 [Nocardioides immobilis]|uniref:Uncharacterized protein n=1 Tax=Nocardioides immobilis TaxID=2049295 RepID=A0A417XS69_9ACTN|nr:hypothetical protein [Nocardioides immobilis]RHW22777.1 hypothetical protein D0Z08_31195 [Nocardioides immobilis]
MSIDNNHNSQLINGSHPAAHRQEIGFDSSATKIPRRHTITSCIGLGPMPLNQVIAVHNLADEAVRFPLPRDGRCLTYNEAAVRAKPQQAAQQQLDRKVTKIIEPEIEAIRPLMAEINVLTAHLDQVRSSPMRGAVGEKLTPEEAEAHHDQTRSEIHNALQHGSKKHLIKGRSKAKEIALLLIDFPVFLYALMSLLNVNYRLIGSETGTTIKATVAGIFALLGTLMLAVVARGMGRQHRAFKGDSSTIETDPKNRRRIRLELIAVAAVVIAAVFVMASRVITDGLEADVMPLLVYALAALFGLLIGFSAYLNYASEYDNGSEQTDRVQHLSVQLRGREATLEGMANARKLRVEETGIRIAKLNRLIEQTRTGAEHRVTGSKQDKAIKLARSYHGLTGSKAGLPSPALDYRRLDLAAAQARELTDDQAYLANLTTEN